jgi:hypothetical protein
MKSAAVTADKISLTKFRNAVVLNDGLSRASPLWQYLDHEYIEIGSLVVSEGSAPSEAIAQIQGMRRLKGGTSTRFQIKTGIASVLCGLHDLRQNSLPHPLSEEGGPCPHGFDFTGLCGQLFQSAATAQSTARPSRPERSAWGLETVNGQGVDMPGGRIAVHSGEVLSDDALNIRRTQVVYMNFDGHGGFLRSLTIERSGSHRG